MTIMDMVAFVGISFVAVIAVAIFANIVLVVYEEAGVLTSILAALGIFVWSIFLGIVIWGRDK